MDGFLVVDKPSGVTSFDVIRRLRGALATRQIGHAGTLDPAATGVMVLGLGRATRLLDSIRTEPKVYTFEVRFGSATDTLDHTGTVTQTHATLIDRAAIETVLGRFTGAIQQSPPRFSAVKIGGKRAYSRARNNEQFETRPREVTIHELSMSGFDEAAQRATMRVSCSSGTYVRTLAADIATAAGSCAHAAHIRRLAAGAFTLERAMALDATPDELVRAILPPSAVLDPAVCVRLSLEHLRELSYGRSIRLDHDGPGGVLVGLTAEGEVAALLEPADGGLYHPSRVLLTSADPSEARR